MNGKYLGKFTTVAELDRYIDNLVEEYKDKWPDVSITAMHNKAIEDGVILNAMHIWRILKKYKLPIKPQFRGWTEPQKYVNLKKDVELKLKIPKEVYGQIQHFRYKTKLFNFALRLILGMNVEELLVTLDTFRTVIFIKDTKGKYIAIVNTPLSNAEARIMQTATAKGNETGKVRTIRQYLESFGYRVYGGHDDDLGVNMRTIIKDTEIEE